MKLRVVIAGISHWHAPRYVASIRRRGAELAAVSDHDPGVAGSRAQELGCRPYASTADMLAKEKPEFAIVLPRHDLALSEITAVADRRVAALVEKPMGVNSREAFAAAAAMQHAGVFAAACLPNRHLRFWEAIHTLESESRLGTPIHAAVRLLNGSPERYRNDGVAWMLDPAISGGGALRNLGAHGTDAALVLAHGQVRVRNATVSRYAHGLPIEDHALATLVSDSGFVTTLEVGYTNARPGGSDQEFRLAATGAYIVDANGTLTISTPGSHTVEPSRVAADTYPLMFDETLDRFESGREPVVGLKACAEAIQLLDEIYACAERGTTVEAAA